MANRAEAMEPGGVGEATSVFPPGGSGANGPAFGGNVIGEVLASGQYAEPGSEEDLTRSGARAVGRYELHTEIASGGMAAVHLGRLIGPIGFSRTVAIKRLHPPLARDPEFVAMFLDEARLAARIRHPNVVSTLDVVATGGELFVVMDYVPGDSLARILRLLRVEGARVPPAIAASILVGVLHGLHAAHEARDEMGEPLKLVHRDVSPHNVLVGTDGAAHLIDFGVAKARGRVQVTREGQVKGKISYMAPEQLLCRPLDRRADIFAASVVFWETLTGKRLFDGEDEGAIYAKVLKGQVEAPSVHAPGLPAAIDAVLLRGLSPNPEDRHPTARAMALAIESAIPLAPPSKVGRWVERVAGQALAERLEDVARIEHGSASEPGLGDASAASLVASFPCADFSEGSLPSFEANPTALDRHAPLPPVKAPPIASQPALEAGDASISHGSGVRSSPSMSGIAADGSGSEPRGMARARTGLTLALMALASGLATLLVIAWGFPAPSRAPAAPHPAAVVALGPRAASPVVPTADDSRDVTAASSVEGAAGASIGSASASDQAPSRPAAALHSGRSRGAARAVPFASPIVHAPALPPTTTPAPTGESSVCSPYTVDDRGNKKYNRRCAE